MSTTVKGRLIGSAHVSLENRKYHGDKAIKKALEEIKKKYEKQCDKEGNFYATYHIAITIEK